MLGSVEMAKIKKYTKEECELIYSNSIKKKNKLTHQELAEKLGRTVEGIRKKELELKRKSLSKRRCSGWSEEDIKKLQAVLDKDNFNITDLDKAIKGKDTHVIKEKALELLTTGSKNNGYNRPWTEEETDYLKRWWGLEDDVTIGIYLKRSREGLRVRAKKLGICNKKIYYTARECAGMLGITDSRFVSYIQKGYIKSRKAKTEQFIHQIKHEELLEFMENHQDKWDSRDIKISPFLIEQPDWFIEKCKRDSENDIDYLNAHKKWTDEEYNYLLEARAQNISFEDIAKKLNRSATSVAHKYKNRYEFERKRKEREAKKEFERIKKLDYDTLDRLNQEFRNEKSYILRKVYKINKSNITEDDVELLSNLKMLSLTPYEIKELTGLHSRDCKHILENYKDEEYVVNIDTNRLNEDKELKLFEESKNNSLYELCLMFNKDYSSIINTYNKVLKNKYNTNEVITWTLEDDIKYILFKLQGMKNRLIGQKLGKTEVAIRSRMALIRNRPFTPNDKREWSKDELKALKIYKEDNNKINIDDLTKVFRRTKKCINKKINEL